MTSRQSVIIEYITIFILYHKTEKNTSLIPPLPLPDKTRINLHQKIQIFNAVTEQCVFTKQIHFKWYTV